MITQIKTANLGFDSRLDYEILKCPLFLLHFITYTGSEKQTSLFISYQRYLEVILCYLARKCCHPHSGLIYALAFVAILFLSENRNWLNTLAKIRSSFNKWFHDLPHFQTPLGVMEREGWTFSLKIWRRLLFLQHYMVMAYWWVNTDFPYL